MVACVIHRAESNGLLALSTIHTADLKAMDESSNFGLASFGAW